MSPQAILTAINFRRYPFFYGIILLKFLFCYVADERGFADVLPLS